MKRTLLFAVITLGATGSLSAQGLDRDTLAKAAAAPVARNNLARALPTRLTLRQAENYALANQPILAASEFRARAEEERVAEARSDFFPQLQGYSVGVKAKDDNSRLAATYNLSNSTILTRQSDGISLSQLITDFGRTYYLTSSAHFNALSAGQRVQVARETLLFRVDQAYFGAEGAQALLRVAEQTASTDQLMLDRVRALAKSSFKSTLDVSFSEVNAAQANLLELQANARVQEGFSELSAALGIGKKTDFDLEPQELEPPPSSDFAPYLAEALAHRPDLLAARADLEAAQRFAKAESAARLPTVEALGSYGVSPAHLDKQLPANYGAAGVDLSVPVFTGGRLSARAREAAFRARAARKVMEDQETEAARDVFNAWQESRTAYQALGVSQQLLTSAREAFQLATSRYQVGASSIVELSEVELQEIQAQITAATARFDYQVRRRALDFQLGALK